ncbi:MAG: 50S ribosomal protein L16 [Armatimonadetes bacterium]|jgi:large subunit ribosomal protein L16|nr:50S ribosomal protein L16 [Armatimonadota bacterium]
MLMPRREKYRRLHRGRMRGETKGGAEVSFGDIGLMALEPCWIKASQIESARIAMTRKIRRGGKVWIRIFPHKSVTKKPAETRMGSGKGIPEFWVAVVKPGRIMFEMGGAELDLMREALGIAAHKLPVPCKIVYREGLGDAE